MVNINTNNQKSFEAVKIGGHVRLAIPYDEALDIVDGFNSSRHSGAPFFEIDPQDVDRDTRRVLASPDVVTRLSHNGDSNPDDIDFLNKRYGLVEDKDEDGDLVRLSSSRPAGFKIVQQVAPTSLDSKSPTDEQTFIAKTQPDDTELNFQSGLVKQTDFIFSPVIINESKFVGLNDYIEFPEEVQEEFASTMGEMKKVLYDEKIDKDLLVMEFSMPGSKPNQMDEYSQKTFYSYVHDLATRDLKHLIDYDELKSLVGIVKPRKFSFSKLKPYKVKKESLPLNLDQGVLADVNDTRIYMDMKDYFSEISRIRREFNIGATQTHNFSIVQPDIPELVIPEGASTEEKERLTEEHRQECIRITDEFNKEVEEELKKAGEPAFFADSDMYKKFVATYKPLFPHFREEMEKEFGESIFIPAEDDKGNLIEGKFILNPYNESYYKNLENAERAQELLRESILKARIKLEMENGTFRKTLNDIYRLEFGKPFYERALDTTAGKTLAASALLSVAGMTAYPFVVEPEPVIKTKIEKVIETKTVEKSLAETLEIVSLDQLPQKIYNLSEIKSSNFAKDDNDKGLLQAIVNQSLEGMSVPEDADVVLVDWLSLPKVIDDFRTQIKTNGINPNLKKLIVDNYKPAVAFGIPRFFNDLYLNNPELSELSQEQQMNIVKSLIKEGLFEYSEDGNSILVTDSQGHNRLEKPKLVNFGDKPVFLIDLNTKLDHKKVTEVNQ